MQWFAIGRKSLSSGLAIGRSDIKSNCVSLQPIVNLDGRDVPSIINHCIAFNDRSEYSLTVLSTGSARVPPELPIFE